MTGEDVVSLVGASSSAAYEALAVLERSGVLGEVTGRRRDRLWVVTDVVGELEDLQRRVTARLTAPA